eukprot:763182-Pelagomonas_calceolata.AAC.2
MSRQSCTASLCKRTPCRRRSLLEWRHHHASSLTATPFAWNARTGQSRSSGWEAVRRAQERHCAAACARCWSQGVRLAAPWLKRTNLRRLLKRSMPLKKFCIDCLLVRVLPGWLGSCSAKSSPASGGAAAALDADTRVACMAAVAVGVGWEASLRCHGWDCAEPDCLVYSGGSAWAPFAETRGGRTWSLCSVSGVLRASRLLVGVPGERRSGLSMASALRK